MARLRNITTVVGFAGVPVGTIVPFAGASAPSGWLLCDGSAISRTTYLDLFNVVNTIHGAGDGSTTFNIPDTRQKFILGKAASGTGSVLGTTGGQIDHTHSLPAHHHAMGTGADLNITSSGSHTTAIDHSHSAGTTGAGTAHSHGHTLGTAATSHSHGHNLSTDSHGGHTHDISHGHSANSGFVSNDHTHNFSGSTNVDGSHGHTIHDPQHLHYQTTTANPGSGNGSYPWQAGVRQTYDNDGVNYTAYPMEAGTYHSLTGVYINADGPHQHGFSGTTGGINQNHNHSITVNNHSGSSGSAGSHSHSVSGGSITAESAHTHTVTGSISNESAHTHSFTTPAFAGNSASTGVHTHVSGNFAGRIGLVTGGVDGNSAMASGSTNPPFYVLNHIIKH